MIKLRKVTYIMFVCLVFVNAEININGHIAKGVQKYNPGTCEYLS